MDNDEVEAIDRYKFLQRRLPKTETLFGLWAPDFDSSAYPELDEFDAMTVYLDDLKSYAIALDRAATARQYHYENWIKGKVLEDEGHRYWREGMNAIAKDAMEKLAYWETIHDNLFNKIIEKYERKRSKAPTQIDLTITNVDYETKESKSKKIVNRPKLSDAEKKKRAKERKLMIAKREAQAKKELEVIAENIVEKHEKLIYDSYTFTVKEFIDTFNDPILLNTDAEILVQNMNLIGTEEEFEHLALLYVNYFLDQARLTQYNDSIETPFSIDSIWHSPIVLRYKFICDISLQFRKIMLLSYLSRIAKFVKQEDLILLNNYWLIYLLSELTQDLPAKDMIKWYNHTFLQLLKNNKRKTFILEEIRSQLPTCKLMYIMTRIYILLRYHYDDTETIVSYYNLYRNTTGIDLLNLPSENIYYDNRIYRAGDRMMKWWKQYRDLLQKKLI